MLTGAPLPLETLLKPRLIDYRTNMFALRHQFVAIAGFEVEQDFVAFDGRDRGRCDKGARAVPPQKRRSHNSLVSVLSLSGYNHAP